MKYFLLICIGIFIFIGGSAQSKKYFSLSDSTFETGSAYRADVIYDLDGKNLPRPESFPCLDSIADFMLKHPGIILEVGCYTDQRGSDSSNIKISQARANNTKAYLVSHGVPEWSLAAVGYGEQFPLVTQSCIDTAKTNVLKENLYQSNRRTEFRILYKYGNSVFSLKDSLIPPGAIMRLPVMFDLGKSTLRPESLVLIDSLAKFLIAHPQLTVEVGNHVDMRASNTSCSKPTQSRAQSIVDRLVLDGVPKTQVIAKGYGETHPLITEKYIIARQSKQGREQLYQLNRRTELRIIQPPQ